jgi:hypothetical protein
MCIHRRIHIICRSDATECENTPPLHSKRGRGTIAYGKAAETIVLTDGLIFIPMERTGIDAQIFVFPEQLLTEPLWRSV